MGNVRFVSGQRPPRFGDGNKLGRVVVLQVAGMRIRLWLIHNQVALRDSLTFENLDEAGRVEVTCTIASDALDDKRHYEIRPTTKPRTDTSNGVLAVSEPPPSPELREQAVAQEEGRRHRLEQPEPPRPRERPVHPTSWVWAWARSCLDGSEGMIAKRRATASIHEAGIDPVSVLGKNRIN